MTDRALNPGWKVWRFDQIAVNVADRVEPCDADVDYYVGLEHLDSDSLKIRRWGEPSDVEATKLLFREGDIIFGRRRVYQRKLAVAEFDGICSAHAMVLRPKTDVVLPEFLPFFMQSDLFMNRALEISVGSLSPTINWRTIARQELALPPLAEQQRIVRLLLSLEHLHESYHEAADRARRLSVSRVAHFLSNYAAKRYAQPVGKLLRESPRNGFSPPTNDSSQGPRTVSISAITDGYFMPEGNIKYANASPEEVAHLLVKKNDIFAVRGNGNLYLTGKCGISRASYHDLFYPDLLIRLRFDESRILPKFAVLQWNSPVIHRNLISRAKTTSGIWKINGQDIL